MSIFILLTHRRILSRRIPFLICCIFLLEISLCSKAHRIDHYNMFQGLPYNDQVSWIDKKYNGSQSSDNNNNFLSNGLGCLTDGLASVNSPFSENNCWIGWNKSRVPNPYIELILSRDTNDVCDWGFGIKTYHDYLNGFSKMKSIKITYKTLINSKKENLLGYVRPRNYSYIYISMDELPKANSVKFYFEYRSSWLLMRQISILQKGKFYKNKYNLTCLLYTSPSPRDS